MVGSLAGRVATARRGRLQKPAVAHLALDSRRALYVGPPLGVGLHRGAVACLALALDGAISVGVAGHAPTGPTTSALIGAGLRHRIDATGTRVAFLYLDPDDALVSSLRQEMTSTRHPLVQAAHRGAAALVQRLEAGAGLAAFASEPGPRLDPRIARTLRRLGDVGLVTASATELASDLGLSPSRFMHLFRAHVGVPYRRYRLWARLRVAVRSFARGHTWTRAAVEAGFASPAHLSDAFRAMFGVAPSALAGVHIETAAQPLRG